MGYSSAIHHAPYEKKVKIHTIDEVRAVQETNAVSTHAMLDNMHKEIVERSDAKRKQQVDAHNRKTKVRPVNFTVDNFLLCGVRQRVRKSQVKWHDPFWVVKNKSEYVFTSKNILGYKT